MTDWFDERESKACFVLGVLLDEVSESDCADVMYDRAVTLDPRAAGPHLRIGFNRWDAQDAVGMYEAFSTAVRLDPQAVRELLPGGPEEARLISLILYPKQYWRPAKTRRAASTKEADEWGERLERAKAEMAAGRDEEAIRTLETLLRMDPQDLFSVPLLALAYLLLRASGEDADPLDGSKSMLLKVQPELAKRLSLS
jgi:tetratricopeptide (TPR) repeat protein